MKKIIAYCGLVCSDCPSYLATQNDDDALRELTASFYAKQYGFDLKPEDINCDGCLSENGVRLEYCQSCKIRKCCSNKSLDNCTVCKDQPCEELTKFFDFSPAAKTAYESLLKDI